MTTATQEHKGLLVLVALFLPQGDLDYRPDVIRDLVEGRTNRGRQVLADNIADGHPDEWLEAMMGVGLLALGDATQLDAPDTLIEKRDWDFGRGTAARWYKRFKPLLWEGAKLAAKSYLGLPLSRSLRNSPGAPTRSRVGITFRPLSGSGDRRHSPRPARIMNGHYVYTLATLGFRI